MPYTWISCDLETGNVLADFPDLQVDAVRQTIGRYESVTATFPVPTAPENWVRATEKKASVMILLRQAVDNAGNWVGPPNPVWGGVVITRTRDQGDIVQLALATAELLLDDRYTGTRTYTGIGQNAIAADLINSCVAVGVNGGLPIRVNYVTGIPSTIRTRTYADQDDKTVGSALTDLMTVQGGPEWFISWEHQTSPERYTPVFNVGDRVGTPTPAGFAPNATFEMPGPVTAFQFFEDFTAGKAANSVVATSSGQGAVRPQSPPAVFSDPIRPTIEYRWTPSTSITEIPTLSSWAAKVAAQLAKGTNSLTLAAHASTAPAIGNDWFLGDDVGYKIGGLVDGKDTVPSVPGGLVGVGRAIGYELTPTETSIITPILTGITS